MPQQAWLCSACMGWCGLASQTFLKAPARLCGTHLQSSTPRHRIRAMCRTGSLPLSGWPRRTCQAPAMRCTRVRRPTGRSLGAPQTFRRLAARRAPGSLEGGRVQRSSGSGRVRGQGLGMRLLADAVGHAVALRSGQAAGAWHCPEQLLPTPFT